MGLTYKIRTCINVWLLKRRSNSLRIIGQEKVNRHYFIIKGHHKLNVTHNFLHSITHTDTYDVINKFCHALRFALMRIQMGSLVYSNKSSQRYVRKMNNRYYFVIALLK